MSKAIKQSKSKAATPWTEILELARGSLSRNDQIDLARSLSGLNGMICIFPNQLNQGAKAPSGKRESKESKDSKSKEKKSKAKPKISNPLYGTSIYEEFHRQKREMTILHKKVKDGRDLSDEEKKRSDAYNVLKDEYFRRLSTAQGTDEKEIDTKKAPGLFPVAQTESSEKSDTHRKGLQRGYDDSIAAQHSKVFGAGDEDSVEGLRRAYNIRIAQNVSKELKFLLENRARDEKWNPQGDIPFDKDAPREGSELATELVSVAEAAGVSNQINPIQYRDGKPPATHLESEGAKAILEFIHYFHMEAKK